MPPVSNVNDVGITDTYEEWWKIAQLALVFPMDQPISFLGPLTDKRDEEEDIDEDTRIKVFDLFIDEIDED